MNNLCKSIAKTVLCLREQLIKEAQNLDKISMHAFIHKFHATLMNGHQAYPLKGRIKIMKSMQNHNIRSYTVDTDLNEGNLQLKSFCFLIFLLISDNSYEYSMKVNIENEKRNTFFKIT